MSKNEVNSNIVSTTDSYRIYYLISHWWVKLNLHFVLKRPLYNSKKKIHKKLRFKPLRHSDEIHVFCKKKFLELSSLNQIKKTLIWAFEAFGRNPRFLKKNFWSTCSLYRPFGAVIQRKKFRKKVDFCQIIVRSIQLLRLRVNRQRRQNSCWYVLNLRSSPSPLMTASWSLQGWWNFQ